MAQPQSALRALDQAYLMGIGQGPAPARVPRTRGQSAADMLGAAAIGTTPIPIVGDVVGVAADAAMYAADRKTRTLPNYAMSVLGMLPFVPGVAAVKAARDAASPLEGTLGKTPTAADDLAALTAKAPMALRDAPRINEEESIGLRAAQNTLARNQQGIIDSAIESVREEGINVESLISDPKYWDAENEQFTDKGFIEYERLIETEGKRRANIRAVESLADLNDASHDAQADAFYAIAELRGLKPSVDYSFGGSRYITLQDGTKFRFANHGNTVRDSSMQPDVNVAPDQSTFTDALERLPSATAVRAARGANALEGTLGMSKRTPD